MMIRIFCAAACLELLLVGSASAQQPTPLKIAAARVSTRADTAGVLEAVWRAAAGTRKNGRVTWLYLPNADSAAVTVSSSVRDALARRGVPASARLPAGNDTVVYRVFRWTRDPAGILVLELHSRWTQAMANAPGGCVLAGTAETFRVTRTRSGWEAERIGVLHGDGYCGSERPPTATLRKR